MNKKTSDGWARREAQGALERCDLEPPYFGKQRCTARNGPSQRRRSTLYATDHVPSRRAGGPRRPNVGQEAWSLSERAFGLLPLRGSAGLPPDFPRDTAPTGIGTAVMPRQHDPRERVLNKRAIYGSFPAPKYQTTTTYCRYWYIS